jgi:hypothetical protein
VGLLTLVGCLRRVCVLPNQRLLSRSSNGRLKMSFFF